VMNGVTTIVKVAHIRLCHSRMMFVRAHPRETQEMVFDAHERAFSFFKGACRSRTRWVSFARASSRRD
jgi:transposase